MRRYLLGFPAMSAGVIQAAIALAIALGLHLTARQAGGIEAVTAALAAAYAGWKTRPFEPALLTGALTAIGTLLIAFRVPHASAALVSAAYAVLAAVLAGILHGNVSPVPASPPAPAGAHQQM